MSYYSYPHKSPLKSSPCYYCRLNTRNSFYPGKIWNIYRNDESGKGAVQLLEQNIAPASFKLSYPIVTNMADKAVESRINQAIIDEVSRLFKNSVLYPEQINFIEILGTYEIKLNEKGLLSILFSIYTYVYHAAHGITIYSSLTFDTHTGRVYKFSDLFTSKINYIPILNDIARKYIEKNDIMLINEYKGIEPNQEFYLTPDELVIYYQVYAYTPYAYGLFQIPIPYTQIQNLLGPASPVQRLL